MSNSYGETDNRLRDRPAIQDAGVASHPAIATDQSADIYDPRRAKGVAKIGGNPADDGILVSPGETSSRKAKAIRRYPVRNAIVHAARMAKADERRRLAVAAYEGGMRLGAVARDYGVNPRTILDWSARFRPADTPRRRPDKSRPVEVVTDYDSVHVAGINRGAGGSMSDHQVREATVRLEKSIIALQRKRGWQTFTYAKEA